MKITRMSAFLVLGVILLSPAEVIGASCPYCGRVYGEAAPGDEARVDELRRQHELTCPSRPRGKTRSATSYGVVTIYNPNDQQVTFQIRSRQDGIWSDAKVEAHNSYYHWQVLPASFQIRLDNSFKPGYQEEIYELGHNIISGRKPKWYEGKRYELAIIAEQIGLQTAAERTVESYTTYCVVTIVNTADRPIDYQIRYRRDGDWAKTTTVNAQSSYYHWVEDSAGFKIKFDRSFKKGYQNKTASLKHNKIKGRKPTADDGRKYELKLDGEKIKLDKVPVDRHILGAMSTARAGDDYIKAALLTAADVSLTGTGQGQTSKDSFGQAKRAKGSVTLTYMPRIDGSIPTVDDSWKATMIEDQTSEANSLYKTQVWEFRSMKFGKARAVVQGSETGATGTATGWESGVPGNRKAEKFPIRFSVEFAGESISLKQFSKSY